MSRTKPDGRTPGTDLVAAIRLCVDAGAWRGPRVFQSSLGSFLQIPGWTLGSKYDSSKINKAAIGSVISVYLLLLLTIGPQGAVDRGEVRLLECYHQLMSPTTRRLKDDEALSG